MPVKIYSRDEGAPEVAWLCEGNWRLPDQAETLEQWLRDNRSTLRSGDYIVDIGFAPREDALGGGAAISPESMRLMADLGITLFLSEYPADESN